MSEDFDTEQAIAERQLDRLDDDRASDEEHSGPIVEEVAELDEGMHVEDRDLVTRDRHGQVIADEPEAPVTELTGDERDELLGLGVDPEVVDVLDALSEVYNARDLDRLLQLAADDCETPGLAGDIDEVPEAIEDLWERRPNTLLTRGELDGEPVGVLWEVGPGGEWWPIASVHLDDVHDDCAGVIEFADDPMTLDLIEADPPEGDLEEGSRWEEWEEGAEV